MRLGRAAWVLLITAAALLAVGLGTLRHRWMAPSPRARPGDSASAPPAALSQGRPRPPSPASPSPEPDSSFALQSPAPPSVASLPMDPVVARELAREQLVAALTEVARLDLEIARHKAKGEAARVDELGTTRAQLLQHIAALRADAGLANEDEDDSE